MNFLSIRMATIAEITKAIADANATQTLEIVQKFEAINKRIDALDNRLDMLEKTTDIHVRKNEAFVSDFQHRMLLLEDKFERKNRADQVIIRNIPFVTDENINEIFLRICSKIGCSALVPAPIVRRLSSKKSIVADTNAGIGTNLNQRQTRKNSAKVKSRTDSAESSGISSSQTQHIPAILVKFWVPHNKMIFMRAYIGSSNLLNLTSIGFSVPNRIVIRDNLTPRNHQIFLEAMKYKSSGLVTKVKTIDGIVSCVTRDNKITLITDISKLIDLPAIL